MKAIKDILAQLNFDIRVESLAATLLECEPALFKHPEQFLVRPGGHLTRSGGKELQKVEAVEQWTDADEKVVNLYLDINREGLYDILPEALFLHPDEPCENDAEKAELLSKQVAAGRLFLLPFEEAFYQARIGVEYREQTALLRPDLFLATLFGEAETENSGPVETTVDDELTRSRRTLALILPVIDQLIAQPELRKKALERILGKKVSIDITPPEIIPIPAELQSTLGEDSVLGENTVLGQSFMDGIPTTKISIQIDKAMEADRWIPQSENRKFVESTLFPLVFPSDTRLALHIDSPPQERGFALPKRKGSADENGDQPPQITLNQKAEAENIEYEFSLNLLGYLTYL